jgi:hypothetical protein
MGPPAQLWDQWCKTIKKALRHMINRLLNWLKSPYPLLYGDTRDYVQIIVTSIFISALIYVIQPFGLERLSSQSLVLFVAKVGSSAMLVSVILTQILPRYLFNEDTWQIWKQASLIMVNLSVVAFTLQLMVFGDLGIATLMTYLAITILIASGPIFIRLLITQNQLLKANLAQVLLANEALETNKQRKKANEVLVRADDGETLLISEHQLVYAKAEKNYTEIFLKKEEKVTATILRMPLSLLMQQLEHNKFSLIHCHRSFVVNKQSICKVAGNSRGYSLELDYGNCVIPVSRSKTKQVMLDLEI